MSHFARNIKYLRCKRKLRQDEFYQSLNIKKTTFSNYEVGRSEPSIESLIEISKFFGVTLDDFLTKDLEKEGLFINTPEEQPKEEIKTEEIKCLSMNCDLLGMIERKDQQLIEMSEEIGKLKQEVATLKKDDTVAPYHHAAEPELKLNPPEKNKEYRK